MASDLGETSESEREQDDSFDGEEGSDSEGEGGKSDRGSDRGSADRGKEKAKGKEKEKKKKRPPVQWPCASLVQLTAEAIKAGFFTLKRAEKAAKYEEIAKTINELAQAARSNFTTDADGVRRKVPAMVEKFAKEQMENMRKSGTEEQYDLLERNLQELLEMKEEAAREDGKLKGQKKRKVENDKKGGASLRDAAAARLSEKRQGDDGAASDKTPGKGGSGKRFRSEAILESMREDDRRKAEDKMKIARERMDAEREFKERELAMRERQFEHEAEQKELDRQLERDRMAHEMAMKNREIELKRLEMEASQQRRW